MDARPHIERRRYRPRAKRPAALRRALHHPSCPVIPIPLSGSANSRSGVSYHSFFMRRLTIPIGLALLVFQARPANNFALTIDNIMRGSALVGYEPSQVRWSADSELIYFQWKQATSTAPRSGLRNAAPMTPGALVEEMRTAPGSTNLLKCPRV